MGGERRWRSRQRDAMFWRVSGFTQPSPVEAALDRPNCTLEDLLGEDDLIQVRWVSFDFLLGRLTYAAISDCAGYIKKMRHIYASSLPTYICNCPPDCCRASQALKVHTGRR